MAKAKEPSGAERALARYQEIAVRAQDDANALLEQERPADAVRVLTDAQRDLRDLKREIVAVEREARLDATAARQKATSQAQSMALLGKTMGRAGSRGAAVTKNQISQQQTALLASFAPVKVAIDQMVANLDRAKADIKASSREQQAQQAAAAVPPPPAGQWAADPSGRHELRWWDGGRWTEHVVDRGQQAVDPLR